MDEMIRQETFKMIKNSSFKKANEILDFMLEHPESVDENDKNSLEELYSKVCKGLNISEHSQWRVDWRLEKWNDTSRMNCGYEPDEVICDGQNVILDIGANEMLKLISGTGGTAYNSSNAYIFVGTDTTPENASQNGVIATGNNRAYAGMDSGYPVVNGRQTIFRASFGDTSANFSWNESAIVNGIGANAIAMNRKVLNLGTKTTGTWSLQVTISLTSS